MEIINDSLNAPMRFVTGDKTFGLYYNSLDKHYHLCEYIPHKGKPKIYVCGKTGNYSPSRGPLSRKKICPLCFISLFLPKDEKIS